MRLCETSQEDFMKAHTDRISDPERSPALYNLVVSSGGSRAILAGAGTIVACHLAGITQFRTVGGVSGGSIPTALLASGIAAPKLLRHAMAVDFSELVDWEAGIFGSVLAFLKKDFYEQVRNRPVNGILNTEKLGAFIESFSPTWPENFWTMAAAGNSQIVFTKDGVFEFTADGKRITLSDKPAPLGLAIRASCTIPGIISAVQFGDRYLFDGALTRDGICPVGVKIRHFGFIPGNTIACCVGEEFMNGIAGYLRRLWRSLFGGDSTPEWGPETGGVIEVHPHFNHINALSFKLSEDDKWLAVVLSFRETVIHLADQGVLTGEARKKAFAMLAELRCVRQMKPASQDKPQLLASKAAQVFLQHGLY